MRHYYITPTASLTFQLPRDETNHKLVLEVRHRDTGTIETHTLPLPEMPQIGNLRGIDVCFPKDCIVLDWISMDFTSLPIDRSLPIPLRVDLDLPHAGVYEVIKRAEDMVGSEQRCVLVVEDVNN